MYFTIRLMVGYCSEKKKKMKKKNNFKRRRRIFSFFPECQYDVCRERFAYKLDYYTRATWWYCSIMQI